LKNLEGVIYKMARKMKFIREDYTQLSGLGLRRKKLWKYRKATGLDNKVRLKIKGHYRNVSIGFGTEKKTRGLIKGLKPVLVHNLKEIKKLDKNETGILANIGSKKKIEIANYVIENKIKLANFNAQKFLEKNKEIRKQKKEEKMNKMNRKKKEEKRKEELQKEKSEKKEDLKEIEKVEKEVAEKIAEEVEKKDEGKESEKTEAMEEKKIVKKAVKKVEKKSGGDEK
jgi:ribosomal protein L32E